MSRGRHRKSAKRLFSPKLMKSAMKDVTENNLSLRKAADKYNAKYQTLARYVKLKRENPNKTLSYKPHYDSRRVVHDEQELLLTTYILERSKMCYGKSTKDVRQLAYELCIHNNIEVHEACIKHLPYNFSAK